uniref:AAA+ ATPase domain-containing protein n=1 Tax=Sonderella linearis TaxID=110477 RepID=A0A1Z1MMS1_9FLOR|nr:hypothetical protein [Sonderella linearis]ARW67061.1 hypothetical protein [Sonderella linearis]
MLIADDLDQLLNILPDFIKNPLEQHPQKKLLIEVVMDLGRRPEARFPDGPYYLSHTNVSWYDLDFSIKKIPHFSSDNRSGIEYTLHRISSIKNRKGNIIGLTCRVGRAIFGTIDIVRDLLYNGNSILLLGRPGVGKTTAIREITRVLADEMEKRVVIIDTSNEIAGDGDIPHPAIGRARRMQVSSPNLQHQVMIEAVENHMPEVIIIDEIGTELEAMAARTIAERGVQLVGTAHGNSLENLIKNPILSDLIGGIEYVTLGDHEAKRRGSQKSILERKSVPAFQTAIEIHQRNNWIIHKKVDIIVDQILDGSILSLERRILNNDRSIYIESDTSHSTEFIMKSNASEINKLKVIGNLNSFNNNKSLLHNINKIKNKYSNLIHIKNNQNISFASSIKLKSIQLYLYGINIHQVENTINSLKLSIILTRNIIKADSILALRSYIKYNSKIRHLAKSKQIVIYTIHNCTINNIIRALKQMLNLYTISIFNWNNLCLGKNFFEINALFEVRFAIEKVIFLKKQPVELLPQSDYIRKLQYKLLKIYNMKYCSFGSFNNQRLKIYPI